MNKHPVSVRAQIVRGLLLALRLVIGIPLLAGTGFIAAISFDFALVEPRIWDRAVAALCSLFFATLVFAICKILLFRHHPRAFRPNWNPPSGPGLEDALVPLKPNPTLPTLFAAEKMPKESAA